MSHKSSIKSIETLILSQSNVSGGCNPKRHQQIYKRGEPNGDFTILTNRLCGGDDDDACADLLCGSLVRDKTGDEPHRGRDGEKWLMDMT